MTANKKGLSLSMLTALVIGNMIGSGILLLPASLAMFGSISLGAWIFTGVGSVFLALAFSQLSKMMPHAGGPYLYSRAAFGDFMGFSVAYNYWIAIVVGNAAVAVTLAGYVGSFIPQLDGHNKEMYSRLWTFLVEGGITWILTLINIMGIRSAGFVQIITTILKLVPLLGISLLGLLHFHPEHLSAFNISGKSNTQALQAAAVLTLWAFIGLESATVPADDVNDPADIPRATIYGTLIAAVIYLFCTLAVMGVIPLAQLKNSQDPFTDLATILLSGKYVWIVTWSAIIACIGCINGWILLQGQVPMAAADNNLFPAIFAKRNSHGTPAAGLIISSVLITLLLALTLQDDLLKQFNMVVLLATLGFLLVYFITACAELTILVNDSTQFNRGRLIKAALIAIVAGAYAFWGILGSGMETVFYGAVLFFTSFPVYVLMKWQIKKSHMS